MNIHFEKIRIDMAIEELSDKVEKSIVDKDYSEYIYLSTMYHEMIMLFIIKKLEGSLGNKIIGDFLIETNNILRQANQDLNSEF